MATTLIALVVAAGGLVGCSTVSHRSDPMVVVTPNASLADEPVNIAVTGAGPERQVTVKVRSIDAKGDTWASSASFRTDPAGTVDLRRAVANSGSYTGVNPMGLIDALAPINNKNDDLAYRWRLVPMPQVFHVTVTEAGKAIATAQFTRASIARGVTEHDESIAVTGFFGHYWLPPPGTPRHPGILEFGGSGGGLDDAGSILASQGYPPLDIAYFDEPGLPSALKEIPLEYFAKALTWLSHQPQVAPRGVYVLSVSRGSEAALLLGAHYPNMVHGVIASSPSDIAFGSYPASGSPAWTFDGRPVPYSTKFSSIAAIQDPSAEIAVQNIRGPVFLDCGTNDLVWTSCAYAQNIQTRLAAAHDPYPHVLYRYIGAGHLVGDLLPYASESSTYFGDTSEEQGITPLTDDDADAQLWPHLLQFLAGPASQTGTTTTNATPPAANPANT